MTVLPRVLLGALVSLVLVACGCWGAFKAFGYSIDKPPEISAEYESGEALLVMEDLAGAVIAELAEATGASPFAERSWETQVCSSGWDGHIRWDGYVSAGVAYMFGAADRPPPVDYSDQVADALESLGLEPEIEHRDRTTTVLAERDDGLHIAFYSHTGLTIRTECVVEGGPYVYLPPYGGITPDHDSRRLAEP